MAQSVLRCGRVANDFLKLLAGKHIGRMVLVRKSVKRREILNRMLTQHLLAEVGLQKVDGIGELARNAIEPLEREPRLVELVGKGGGPLDRRARRQDGGGEGLRGALLRQNSHIVSLAAPSSSSLLRKIKAYLLLYDRTAPEGKIK